MVRLWVLFGVMSFSCLFLLYRPTGEIGYVFAEYKFPADTYFYLLFQHIEWILAACVLWHMSDKYSEVFALFFWIQILDMVLYILFYRSPWIGPLPWNAIKLLLFGIAIISRYGHKSNN